MSGPTHKDKLYVRAKQQGLVQAGAYNTYTAKQLARLLKGKPGHPKAKQQPPGKWTTKKDAQPIRDIQDMRKAAEAKFRTRVPNSEEYMLRRLAAETLAGSMPEGPQPCVFEDRHQAVAHPVARALSGATGLTFSVSQEQGETDWVFRVRPQQLTLSPAAWRCCRIIAICIRNLGIVLGQEMRG